MTAPIQTCSSWPESKENSIIDSGSFSEVQYLSSTSPVTRQRSGEDHELEEVPWSEQQPTISNTNKTFWYDGESYLCGSRFGLPSRCAVCNFCGQVDRECTRPTCLFCKKLPIHCKCIRPEHARVQMQGESGYLRTIRLPSVQEDREHETGVDQKFQTVVIQGDMHHILVYRDMFGPLCARLMTFLSPVLNPMKKGINQFKNSRLGWVLRPFAAPFLWARNQFRIRQARRAVAMETDDHEGYVNVTKPEHVTNMIEHLANLPTDMPNISFDMEAYNLGHTSGLSYIQIRGGEISYLVDLLVLQKAAWDTQSTADKATTLRTIFEDPNRIKLVFDCRQDSACLYAKASIRPRGVLDCQYLHMLTMDRCPPSRPGLVQTVRAMAGLSQADLKIWNDPKKGPRLHGVWEKRPVPRRAKAYAIGDVALLRAIYDKAEAMLNTRGLMLATHWTDKEVHQTWCSAEKSVSTGRYMTPDFEKCWEHDLLKPGFEPYSAPRASPVLEM
ncbi:hypothetical protein H2198_003865 [Neophaeococcomyces mojaviensis]|uniref:Uncharacterized protein n=1 Tax=Neophaeococcomyces mojaviensis TaxID=3383035 RepID=A0ACC3AAY9_9EURO|nr:hypothetical protein H2198_003865 [Knufia sp. JES_112]